MGDKPEANIDEAALISAVREGSLAAYGLLYAEFRPMALRRARRLLGKHHDDAEDVVEMAFASILDAIRNGAGPEDNFARYLMVTLRHSAWRVSRRRDREAPLRASHLDDLAYDPQHDHVQPEAVDRGSEVADQRDLLTSSEAAFVGRLDPSTLLSQAFTGLTERHRAALWMWVVSCNADLLVAVLDRDQDLIAEQMFGLLAAGFSPGSRQENAQAWASGMQSVTEALLHPDRIMILGAAHGLSDPDVRARMAEFNKAPGDIGRGVTLSVVGMMGQHLVPEVSADDFNDTMFASMLGIFRLGLLHRELLSETAWFDGREMPLCGLVSLLVKDSMATCDPPGSLT